MVLDHVDEGTGFVVVAGPALDAEGLVEGDLDSCDVLVGPDRLEDAVGEADAEDVLGRLLVQEVVDAEDRRLVGVLVKEFVEGPG